MSDQIVCPLSMSSENIKQCHPMCMLLDDDNNCLLAESLRTKAKENNN